MGYLRPYHVFPNVPPAGLDSLEDAFERYVGMKHSLEYGQSISKRWGMVKRRCCVLNRPFHGFFFNFNF